MASTLTDSLVGRLVDGRYKVDSRIARGGMATVYLATDRRLDRQVALKVMHAHLADGASGADFVSRFRREARAAARLTHPGLVAVFDQGVDGETSYLTMEYVDGTNLRRRLHEDGPFAVGEALQVVGEVLDALAAAHRQNLVHRDIKPENVLLSTDGRVKVADFGLARAVTEVTSTTTGTILGTVAYLGPELISTGACDTRTDVYAVGIMLFEMLTGRQPFVGETPIQVAFQHVNDDVPVPSTVVPWLPAEIDELVCALAARAPEDRPHDAPAALVHLRRVMALLPPDVLGRRADAPPPVVSFAQGTPDDTDAPSSVGEIDKIDEIRVGGDTDEADGPVRGAGATDHLTQALDTRASGSTIAFTLPDRDRLAPATGTAPAVSTSPTAPVDADRPGRDRRRPRRRTLVSVVSILLILGALGGGAFWWFGYGPGSFTSVPTGLAGSTLEDAEARLDAAALLHESVEAFHDTVPAGEVISTDPGDGERIPKDGTVELTVSSGIEHFVVPGGLVGASVGDARASLSSVGFTAVTESGEWNLDHPEGTVLGLSVVEGESLPHNTPVVLAVSKGPEPVVVPQVQSLTLDEATEQLEPWTLAPVVVEEYSETVPEGKVISQAPEQGSAALRGDEVTLKVSLGMPFVEVPDVLFTPVAEARTILEDAGFKVEVNYFMGFLGNEVRSQSEAPGTEVRKGSTITLDL
ncbi:Stk1 family PASTA domain-containing Ser/Thr kinase [Sanguibacter suaedae]|uniref:non-specific serine/threonine protein kinase n=1 Tax=Sanguibacter suaedae TaxID=2795737 RepID=A0A934IAK7_9MICO|nr:Stk1 family PASTA domain-containing Ser/Thr kinase [Sanguibacter suaedae]MBI9114240.1 Stk1 family PASTA domain-containing Ser/Thr kinase [Sanguibacter suaedae]